MFDQLSATCTVKMRLTCKHFSVFPRVFWSLISHFPLLLSFLYNLSLFSFHFRVCSSFKLPFSILRSLMSPLCSCFFFCSSMVDYSSVRGDCPSVAFIFAQDCKGGVSQVGQSLRGGGLRTQIYPFFFIPSSFPFY